MATTTTAELDARAIELLDRHMTATDTDQQEIESELVKVLPLDTPIKHGEFGYIVTLTMSGPALDAMDWEYMADYVGDMGA